MHIISHVELNQAQEHAIEGFERATVRTALLLPCVVATFKTFQGQEVKVTLDKNGVINHVEFTP